MRRMRWALYLWPGLIQLSVEGSWTALGVAFLAGILLDAALLATCVWTELLAHGLRSTLWMALGATWFASAVYAAVWDRKRANRQKAERAVDDASVPDAFAKAMEHYLKGEWYESESILGGLLRTNVRDIEGRLMLATLLRHTGRHDEAKTQLDVLERFEGAEKWQVEIGRERDLLAAKTEDTKTEENKIENTISV
jgi:hypothetical protein